LFAKKATSLLDSLRVQHSEGNRDISLRATLTFMTQLRTQVGQAGGTRMKVGAFCKSGERARLGLPLGDFLEMIGDGKLGPIGWVEPSTLADIDFDRAKLLSILSAKPNGANAKKTLSVKEVACRLGTYIDAIYSLERVGFLKFQRGLIHGRPNVRGLTEADLEEFEKKYVLGGSLARQLGVNPTNFAEKLMHAGVLPVSGPAIDDGLVYLFHKDPVEKLDLKVISRSCEYVTRAGRKPKNSKRLNEVNCGMTEVETASRLNITCQRLRRLVAAGHVERASRYKDRRAYTQSDIEKFCRRYRENPRFVTSELAAERLGVTLKSFRRTWVIAGRINEVTDGLGFFVGVAELNSIDEASKIRLTDVQIRNALGVSRSQIGNWRRLGKLVPVSGPSIDGFKTYQYDRTQVESLCLQR
jgi:predicted site-specific integrase-resolvase